MTFALVELKLALVQVIVIGKNKIKRILINGMNNNNTKNNKNNSNIYTYTLFTYIITLWSMIMICDIPQTLRTYAKCIQDFVCSQNLLLIELTVPSFLYDRHLYALIF